MKGVPNLLEKDSTESVDAPKVKDLKTRVIETLSTYQTCWRYNYFEIDYDEITEMNDFWDELRAKGYGVEFYRYRYNMVYSVRIELKSPAEEDAEKKLCKGFFNTFGFLPTVLFMLFTFHAVTLCLQCAKSNEWTVENNMVSFILFLAFGISSICQYIYFTFMIPYDLRQKFKK